MFARVQTFRQPAEALDELTEFIRGQLPSAREVPGFEGFQYLVDRENEKALLISLWGTEEDLRRFVDDTAERERTGAEAGVKPPPSEVFEVALQELSGPN